ncbi:MAG: hypothetical protein HKN37_12240 [Rhodothermales bacterium]|nr:hypothetical protein [Rhodothermales bacterium]
MKPFHLVLTLLLGVGPMAGCDSTEPTVDDNGGDVTPKTSVVYEVFGTYRTCNIIYRDSLGVDQELPEEPLDWIDSVKVPVDESFLARVTATCADVEREGKATIRLFVDGLLLESASAQGYGSSGTAQRLLSPSS